MVVEHAAVNRGVVSSSLTGAAKKEVLKRVPLFCVRLYFAHCARAALVEQKKCGGAAHALRRVVCDGIAPLANDSYSVASGACSLRV